MTYDHNGEQHYKRVNGLSNYVPTDATCKMFQLVYKVCLIHSTSIKVYMVMKKLPKNIHITLNFEFDTYKGWFNKIVINCKSLYVIKSLWFQRHLSLKKNLRRKCCSKFYVNQSFWNSNNLNANLMNEIILDISMFSSH